MLKFLEEEQIDPQVINGIKEFRKAYAPETEAAETPRYFYYGRNVWEQAAQALLAGENLLLAGAKATGKNVLAENLAGRLRAAGIQRLPPHQCRRGVHAGDRHI